ncbi:MAG: hypothetical protein Kow006_05160 [Gammaproteobacteria bacterium]
MVSTMTRYLHERIRQSRINLRNPYAYLDSSGGYSATTDGQGLDVHEARRILQNQYAYLDADGGYSEWPNYISSQRSSTLPLIDYEIILGEARKGDDFGRDDIEAIVRRFQREMWKRRKELFPSRKEIAPIEMLNPSIALKSIGYLPEYRESLGQYSGDGEIFEVAGILDNSNRRVLVSERFSPEICNFTMAHELGHVFLHQESGLHRDRALDGSLTGQRREKREFEADVFAAYFLLPEKQVRREFKKRFSTDCFLLNDDTEFALGSGNTGLRNSCRTIRDLSRVLAKAEHYFGVQFLPLTKCFRVSTEAMAIRLEELGLVMPLG